MCRLAKDSRQRIRAGPLGLGLLVGLAVLSYGLDCGCTTAEILAINDEGGRPALQFCQLSECTMGAMCGKPASPVHEILYLKYNPSQNRLQQGMIG